ncbi:hypothetical protein FA15DRAFT_566126, partial [Coprinopsis marcescibilis]
YLIIDKGERAVKSWWPLVISYEKEDCGENYGCWTFRNELWYRKCLAAIEDLNAPAQPLSLTEWNKCQCGQTAVRRFRKSIHSRSEKFI